LSAGSGNSSGEFAGYLDFDPATRRVIFRPQRWIMQPPGYAMIGFTGIRNGTAIHGTTDYPTCGSIALSLSQPAPLPPSSLAQTPANAPTGAGGQGPLPIGTETGRPTSADDFHAASAAERSGNYAEAMLLFRRIDAGQDIPVHSPGAATYRDTLTDTRTSIGKMY